MKNAELIEHGKNESQSLIQFGERTLTQINKNGPLPKKVIRVIISKTVLKGFWERQYLNRKIMIFIAPVGLYYAVRLVQNIHLGCTRGYVEMSLRETRIFIVMVTYLYFAWIFLPVFGFGFHELFRNYPGIVPFHVLSIGLLKSAVFMRNCPRRLINCETKIDKIGYRPSRNILNRLYNINKLTKTNLLIKLFIS